MTDKLLKIGELSRQAEISARTIDYYTKLGLIVPETRSEGNYRLYRIETLERLKRIEQLKKDKYTLDEIKQTLDSWNKVSSFSEVNQKLSELEQHLSMLEREVKELEPVIQSMKPRQANQAFNRLIPQTAACIEALMLILNKGNFM